MKLTNPSNTYTGATVDVGRRNLGSGFFGQRGAASSIGAASADPANLVLDGTFRYTGTTDATTDRGFTLANRVTFNTAQALTFSGAIRGSGSFTKSGNGALTLSGINTFAGSATVTGGTLAMDNAANDLKLTALDVQSRGKVNLTSGTYLVNGYPTVGIHNGDAATLSLGSNATLNTTELRIGSVDQGVTGNGAFYQSGGTLQSSGVWWVGTGPTATGPCPAELPRIHREAISI